jgi:hypothetical protein
MTQEHPITPPPELIAKWAGSMCGHYEAARWGSDQELEACVSYVDNNFSGNKARALRALRRPKPPSLKEEALQALAHLENGAHCSMDTTESAHYIRRALESLPS